MADFAAMVSADADGTVRIVLPLDAGGVAEVGVTPAAATSLARQIANAAAPHRHARATPVQEIGGRQYVVDAKGALLPVETVQPRDMLQDELIGRLIGFARDLSAELVRFKAHSFADITAYQDLLAQEYGARAGGPRGNISLMSIDGCSRVTVQVADRIDFGPELQIAKRLVDECLIEWGGESRPELRAVVNTAFAVDQAGRVNQAGLYQILRLDIEDERWQRAMTAIRDSMRVVGTKQYVRFHVRPNAEAGWDPISLDIAAL